ncbi:MAG: chemotaxis protein CheW [Firmicutes bacterium]|nr:chemotaxis protein CheW [Bacillota bacterium]
MIATEERLFGREDEMLSAVDSVPEIQMQQFLIFESDGLLYGADVEYVVEIITTHSVTHLPMVPDYVRGIINLRGQVIPIIDFRLRLGRPYREDACIIVLDVNGMQLGILVDDVAQMVAVPKTSLLPAHDHSAQKLISGMCSLADGSTMLLLDCVLLVES